MIYLIKPHFCIVSRAFVVIRPAIISARPLHPPARNSDRHDHDSPSLTPFPFPFSLPSRTDCSPRSLLPRRALFSFFLSPFLLFLFFFFFFRQSRVMAPTNAEGGGGGGKFPGKPRAQKSPSRSRGNVNTCRNQGFDFVEFQSDSFVVAIAEADRVKIASVGY